MSWSINPSANFTAFLNRIHKMVYRYSTNNDVRHIMSENSGLVFHCLVETPALVGFIYQPSLTLTTHSPQAHAVIRQYGLLLLCTNLLIVLILMYEPTQDEPWQTSYRQFERHVAQVLMLYHMGPLLRAMGRIRAGETQHKILGGPYMHMALHAICGASLWRQSSC